MPYSDSHDVEAHCDDIDPSAATDWRRPRERLKCEYTGLKMVANTLTPSQKWSLAIAGLAYIVWTLYWVLVPESFQVRLLPVHLFYGFLLGYAFGKLHDIQMDQIREFASEGVSVSWGGGPPDESEDDK